MDPKKYLNKKVELKNKTKKQGVIVGVTETYYHKPSYSIKLKNNTVEHWPRKGFKIKKEKK